MNSEFRFVSVKSKMLVQPKRSHERATGYGKDVAGIKMWDALPQGQW